MAVSRFLKFPILGNFAGFGKSRLSPSGRTFPRLDVGGYTRRSDGVQWERASSSTARSFLPPAPSYRYGQGRTGPAPPVNILREGCCGQWPTHLPAVTCKGNQVPVHGVLLPRVSLRSAGEPTLTARATSAPFQQGPCPKPGGI